MSELLPLKSYNSPKIAGSTTLAFPACLCYVSIHNLSSGAKQCESVINFHFEL